MYYVDIMTVTEHEYISPEILHATENYQQASVALLSAARLVEGDVIKRDMVKAEVEGRAC